MVCYEAWCRHIEFLHEFFQNLSFQVRNWYTFFAVVFWNVTTCAASYSASSALATANKHRERPEPRGKHNNKNNRNTTKPWPSHPPYPTTAHG